PTRRHACGDDRGPEPRSPRAGRSLRITTARSIRPCDGAHIRSGDQLDSTRHCSEHGGDLAMETTLEIPCCPPSVLVSWLIVGSRAHKKEYTRMAQHVTRFLPDNGPSPEQTPPIEPGDRLTRPEFERRYDAMP